ncbi:hypothetical protein yc1106_09552 [Curvularia clavata]|uniref:Nephrocystin 3-like N-terminal domain-containing protein n=1 Tax=Curvularia clavata TaxID=95742 RepID=A0A9Q8ZLK6_CURCL|nr:hypothetical protein yc1106_09552 [Curvularia clavata]
MYAGQSELHQNLSHNTVQNGSQGFFGTVQTLNVGSVASLEGIPDAKDFVSHNSDEICIDIEELKAKACRNAIFISDPKVDREELISAKGIIVPGTCEWIKKDKNFKALKRGKFSLLWITGEPGKGKTMLSIFITRYLEETYPKKKEGEVIYHFCVHKKRDTGAALLRGLLYQILNKRHELTEEVFSYFETPEKTQQALSSLEALWVIFLKLIEHPKLGVILCILDGLDECDEHTRRFLLPRFAHYFGSSQTAPRTRFRLIVISRALEGLEKFKKIDLDNDPERRGRTDMELFVCERVDELFREKKFHNSFRLHVQNTLLFKADDTFLWVGFVVNDLLKLRTWSQVQKQLESLPDGLSSIYARMLLEIPEKERETALSILRWVCIAREPLSLLELAELMALQQRGPGPITSTGPKRALDLVDLKQEAKDAVTVCGQILRLKHEVVTFVHKTAGDFLMRKEREENEVLRVFQLECEEAHLLLARACLQSIAQSELYTSIIDQNRPCAPGHSPFLRYAIEYWPQHAQNCCHRASDLFDDFCAVFDSNPGLRQYWWKEHRYLLARHFDWLHPIPLLNMVSYLGITPWIEALVQRNPSGTDIVNEKDRSGKGPIEWACKGRQEKAVETLLAHIARIDKTKQYSSLINKAIEWGNQKILRMLAEKGANFNGSWLHRAVWLGSETEIFKLLLKKGAKLESRDKDGRTPLYLAAELEKERIVSFLIDAGADITTKDSACRTLLHAACSSNMERLVRKLLHMELDIRAKDKFKTTMLHVLARDNLFREYRPLFRLLISEGVEVEAKNCHGSTPLHMAAASHNFALVGLLIEYGADVNAQNRFGNMPLHSALMYGGYGKVARILVRNGADVNAPDDRGYIPLKDCIQKHEPKFPILDPQARVTSCECVRWKLRDVMMARELIKSGLFEIGNPFE